MKSITRLLLVLLFFMGVACQGETQTAVSIPPTQPTETAVSPTPTVSPQTIASDNIAQIESAPLLVSFNQFEQPEAQIDPSIDLENFPVNTPITFYFNQPMNRGATRRPLILSPNVPGETVWSEDGTSVTFKADDRFVPNRVYSIQISNVQTSVSGDTLQGQRRWQIRTENSPRILAHTPTFQYVQQLQPPITFNFNVEMDHTSVEEAFSISPALAYTTRWSDNNFHIILDEPLAFGTVYELLVDETAVSQQNRPIYDAYRFNMGLSDPLKQTRWQDQPNGEQSLVLTWNYAIDVDASQPLFTMTPSASGQWEWESQNKIVRFTADTLLPPSTEYTVTVSQLMGENGALLPEIEPITFKTRSAILSANPNGNNDAQQNSIKVQFDRPMDQASVEAAFQIVPDIPGIIQWAENQFEFIPDVGYFDFNQSYQYQFDTSAASATGEAVFTETAVFSFHTSDYYPFADFGYGSNVQVLDSNGRRAIQFRLNNNQPRDVTFNLYPLDQPTFIQLFTEEYSTNFWEEGALFDLPETLSVSYQWQSETTVTFNEWNRIQETILPNDVPAGFYILEVAYERPNDQLFLIVSENNVIAKYNDRQLTTWLTKGGQTAVSNQPVRLISSEGELLGSGITDDQGVAKIDLRQIAGEGYPLFAIAGEGQNATITGLDSNWQSGWWWSGNGRVVTDQYTTYGITDRPIYQPGQTVFFKGTVRHDDDAILTIPEAGLPVTVRIRDSRNNIVRTFEHQLNDFGTLDGSFELAEGAMLGTYAVEFIIDGESHRQIFKVEAYRKPEFEVSVSTDKDSYVLGDTVELTIDAAYFYGEAVPNANVTITQYQLYENYYYGANPEEAYVWGKDYASHERQGRTDENGQLIMSLEAQASFDTNHYYGSNLRSQKVAYEVTINDGSNQLVSGFVVVEMYNQEAGISIDRGSYIYREGNPINLSMRVESVNGRIFNNHPVHLTIRTYNRVGNDFQNILHSVDLLTDANGRLSYQLPPTNPGYIQIWARSLDSNGHVMLTKTGFYILSEGQTSWYREDNAFAISADKESYQAGETAVLYIESQLDGPALLTVERGTVRRELSVILTPPLTQVELPIIETDAPNIHVVINGYRPQSVTALSEDVYNSLPDADLLTASVNLSVPPTHKQLNVVITPNKEGYAPGEEATFNIRVTNQTGVPVSAEVSLAMVDDAIFALSDELSGPIFEGFYFERNNMIRNYHSYGPIRYMGGGGGGGGGGADGGPNDPRVDFKDTAVWLPTLRTDFNGEVSVTVSLPDNLTRWRLTAKAVTADTQVGETIETVLTQQPFVVRPLLPRILTAGDTVELSALVHNYTNSTQTLTVSLSELDTERLILQSPAEQTITLAPNGVQIVGWTVFAETAGDIELLVTAVTPQDTLADGVQLPLTVQPLAIPEVETAVGQFTNATTLNVNIPTDALDMSEVKIELSRSIAGSVLQGLEDLTGYPYGCVEQTMSKALPNAVVGRALHQLGINNPQLDQDLPKQIEASIQKLYGFQHDDGGWGWWHDDDSHFYQTAWVLFGLANISDAGYEIDPVVLERGAEWLNDNLAEIDPKTRAFALYSMALSGNGNLEATQQLSRQTTTLDSFAMSALALALHELGDRNGALAMLDQLAENAEVENGRVSFPGAQYDGSYDRKTMASTVRNTGLALSAFVQIQPGHELEAGMVRYLMSQRRPFGWGTTNETSFAILGLTDHLVAAGFSESGTSTSYSVAINGIPFDSGQLSRNQPTVTITIPRAMLDAGENEIQLSQSGAAQLYYVANSRTYVAQETIEASGVIEVTRTYIDPATNTVQDTFVPGELVKVRLHIQTPDAISYVIVEDKLPSGLEPLNERLNTTSHATTMYQETRYHWQDYGYNYKEIRDDRVSFFVTEITPGVHVITYLARVTHTGDVVAMPAEVYAMYDVAMWGRSNTAVLHFATE